MGINTKKPARTSSWKVGFRKNYRCLKSPYKKAFPSSFEQKSCIESKRWSETKYLKKRNYQVLQIPPTLSCFSPTPRTMLKCFFIEYSLDQKAHFPFCCINWQTTLAKLQRNSTMTLNLLVRPLAVDVQDAKCKYSPSQSLSFVLWGILATDTKDDVLTFLSHREGGKNNGWIDFYH